MSSWPSARLPHPSDPVTIDSTSTMPPTPTLLVFVPEMRRHGSYEGFLIDLDASVCGCFCSYWTLEDENPDRGGIVINCSHPNSLTCPTHIQGSPIVNVDRAGCTQNHAAHVSEP